MTDPSIAGEGPNAHLYRQIRILELELAKSQALIDSLAEALSNKCRSLDDMRLQRDSLADLECEFCDRSLSSLNRDGSGFVCLECWDKEPLADAVAKHAEAKP